MKRLLVAICMLPLLTSCVPEAPQLTSGGLVYPNMDRYSFVRSLDLASGASEERDLKSNLDGSNFVQLSNNQVLRNSTLAGLNYNYAKDMVYDEANNLLYVAQYSATSVSSVSIIDTKGTASSVDDEAVGYLDSTTTPAIGTSAINGINYNPLTGTLYISTNSEGLYAINTGHNADPSDDSLIHQYLITTTPGISTSNLVRSASHGSDGLLLITTWGGGMRAYDTKGTSSVADDVLVFNYTHATSPALATRYVFDAHYSESLNVIFVASDGGVDIINTAGTPFNAADDTKLGNYSTSSGIALTHNRTTNVYYDESTGLLYSNSDIHVAGNVNGVTIIDTKKTATPADDTLFAQYAQTDLGFSSLLRIGRFTVDSSKNLLYIPIKSTTNGGVFKIDTRGTPAKSDDIVERLDSSGALLSDYVESSIYVPALDTLFIGAIYGISVIPNSFQNLNATFLLKPELSSLWSSNQIIQWGASAPTGTSVTAKVRNANVSFEVDNDDNDVTNVTDYYAWGSIFPTISETAGIVTLTGSPTDPSWAGFSFDSGEAAEFFPAGSFIEVRLKVTTSATGYNDCLYVDNWEGTDSCFEATGDWQTVTLVSTTPFSTIGFQPWWDSGTWQASDKIEIDHVRVITPSAWTSWSSLLNTNKNVGSHDRSYDYFQVGFDLTSNSMTKTPKVKSVSILE